jgi:hypothetical protein
LISNENFAVENVSISLDIVMTLPFSPGLSLYFGKKRQEKNKNENFSEYIKRGNIITALFKESRKKFQRTLEGKKL